MSELFEEITINTMTLRNRSVRSATWAGMAEDGRCSMRLIELIEELAQGEVGLIITGGGTIGKGEKEGMRGSGLSGLGLVQELLQEGHGPLFYASIGRFLLWRSFLFLMDGI